MTQHHPLPTLGRPNPTPEPDDAGPSSDSGSPPETEHLDQIEVEQLEAVGDGPAAPDGAPLGADGFLSVEAFAAGLRAALQLGGHLTSLQSLLASPDAPTFPDAAAAIYGTCRDFPALHFLIRPGGLWLQRAAAVAVWAVPVATACREELRARNARPVQQEAGAEASE